MERGYVGCITGTSVDGLDLAYLNITNSVEATFSSVAAATVPLPSTLRTSLLNLGQPDHSDVDLIDALGTADAALGEFIGQAINDFLTNNNLPPPRAIGTHGQTVRHRPTNTPAFTMQIGDPNRIAEITDITTVSDFRRADIAAGGEGAPLVPPFHKAAFANADLGTAPVILNIGGISNVSVLTDPIRGFDTGPGNCLMDSWIARHKDTPFDRDGEWAASGQVDTELLNALLADPYFGQSPPKSTGREYFNLAWLARHERVNTIAPEHVQATLLALTVRCTIDAIEGERPTALVICGGGRLNQSLVAGLADLADYPVTVSEHHGVDGDSIEAATFAWLAHQCLEGLPGNEPGVTGAKGPRVLGAIYPR